MMRSAEIVRACAALAALLLGACAYPVNGPEEAPTIADRFPITVEPHMEALRVPFNPRGGLDAASSGELDRFARDYVENGSGAISVSAPRRLGEAAPNVVVGRLVSLGVPRNRIMLGSDDANVADEVKVTYIRYQAHSEPCGDWSVNLGYTSENKPSPNLGCATHHNLAVMVADPRDLVTPKPLEPDDAQRRLTVLDKYRKGETTVAEKTQEQSGAVSNVAGGGGGGGK